MLDFREISKSSFISILALLDICHVQPDTAKIKVLDKYVIDIQKNIFFDLNGKYQGGVINFVSVVKGISLYEAAKVIKDGKVRDGKIPELILHYDQWLFDKGILEKTAINYSVGKCSKGIFAGYIVFKCLDREGKVKGYIGIHPKEENWKFPRNFAKDFLYNEKSIENNDFEEVIVVESVIDVLLAAQRGIHNIVALMGAIPSIEQWSLLAKYEKIVVVHQFPDMFIHTLMKQNYVKWKKLDDFAFDNL